jgi:type I restriction enzyme M protein
MVKLVDPQIGETILDPACGTGGFLIWSFFHVLDKIKKEIINEEERRKIEERLIQECLWGIDIDSYLVKLCKINLKIHGDGYRHIYRANSLDIIDDNIEEEHKEVRNNLRKIIEKGGFDIILTNPPFGSGPGKDITEKRILEKYENGRGKRRQIPQILFLELCIRLLKPGGRMAIVLPDGILNNAAKDYVMIRNFIKRECIIKAVISLPQGTFIPYGSGVKASVLFLQRKKSPKETQQDVFMAVAQYVGYDTHTQKYRQIAQNDLPIILNEYRKLLGVKQ